MAKFTTLRFLLIVLIVWVVCACAQRQQQQQQLQQGNSLRKKQQQPVGRPQRKPRPRPGQVKPNKNKEKPKPQKPGQKVQYVTKHIANVGRVRGRIVKTQWSGQKVMQFLDIPYGKSPVGPLRFKASAPAEPWNGILDVFKPRNGCPSLQNFNMYEVLLEKDIDIEDCLRLSINSKSLSGNAPVMVYIHGDFLYDGSSLEAAPGYLLEENIVLVSVRYRLGPFGFLSTLTDDIPGNAAVSDVILALQWVQNHIESFGGDPSRVTLFGQVGGAAMINVLTMSPAVPEGLFHRVIYQSGSALSPAFITDNPIPATKYIAKLAGCKNPNKIGAINKCMRRLNTTAILEAFDRHGNIKAIEGVGSFGATQITIGGPSGILPEHPGKLLAAESFRAYPTLGGSVKNAGSFILKDIYIDNFNETIIDDKLTGINYIQHIISQTNGADPTGAWMQYAQEEIFTPADIKNGSFYRMSPGLIDLCGTISFKNPVLLVLQANAKLLPNSTYLYSFDYEGELNRYATTEDENGDMPFELGVSLTDENLYLFPWPHFISLNTNRDIKVAKRMVAFWTSFATTGIPKAPGVPPWPVMNDDAGPYLKIGKTNTIGTNYMDEYSVAVKEMRMGYNLVNEEYFESLVEIVDNKVNKDKTDSTDSAEVEEGDEEDEETNKAEGDYYDEQDETHVIGQHFGYIPKKRRRFY